MSELSTAREIPQRNGHNSRHIRKTLVNKVKTGAPS
jgi:hypothetical protein